MPVIATTNVPNVEPGKTDGEQTDSGQEDIVVDLSYVELVARLIRARRVDADPDVERMSPALGLGVVVVQDIKALADAIELDLRDTTRQPQPNNPPKTNLEKVLVWLRQEFFLIDKDNKIEVGKNRTVQGVHGTPHIGGGGYPVAATKPTHEPEIHSETSSPVRVGLIDTRVYRHENFGKRLKFIGRGELPPLTPRPPGQSFNHLEIHGTFTVGLILKQAPRAEVLVRAVLRQDLAKATAWDVASAMADFIDHKVQLLVAPLVCFTDDGEPPLALQRAVTLVRRYGIPVIAAAGNHGNNPVDPDGEPTHTWRGFPAACVGAVAVGAADKTGTIKAAFNPQEVEGAKPWITLAGPGIDVESTSVDGKIKYVEIPGIDKVDPWEPEFEGGAKWNGTSFATATVGGVIAAELANGGGSAFEIIEKLQAQPPTGSGIGNYGALEAWPTTGSGTGGSGDLLTPPPIG